jgi:serine/threonine protein phosphatase PrpC
MSTLTLHAASAAATDPGRRRSNNEDAFCARPELGLFVVADGMGGHAAGEVASHLAVDVIESFVNDTRDADVNRTWPFPYDHALSLHGNRLKAACRLANRRLAAAIEADESRRGMATTAVALLLSNGAPVVAHIGDSRCYLWRGDELTQITEDHSWVSEQVRAGVLTDTNARLSFSPAIDCCCARTVCQGLFQETNSSRLSVGRRPSIEHANPSSTPPTRPVAPTTSRSSWWRCSRAMATIQTERNARDHNTNNRLHGRTHHSNPCARDPRFTRQSHSRGGYSAQRRILRAGECAVRRVHGKSRSA